MTIRDPDQMERVDRVKVEATIICLCLAIVEARLPRTEIEIEIVEIELSGGTESTIRIKIIFIPMTMTSIPSGYPTTCHSNDGHHHQQHPAQQPLQIIQLPSPPSPSLLRSWTMNPSIKTHQYTRDQIKMIHWLFYFLYWSYSQLYSSCYYYS